MSGAVDDAERAYRRDGMNASREIRIVELRRYALHPGQRDVLIELFEERFIESQEEVGMGLLGQFVDLDDDNSFVWLRGFADMPQRGRGLAAFYDGPIWSRYHDLANATMIDSDNVLLLRTPSARAALRIPKRDAEAEAHKSGPVAAVIVPVSDTGRALELFEGRVAAAAVRHGGRLIGYFVTEPTTNNFPRLPVREDARVLVFLVGYADQVGLDDALPLVAEEAHPLADDGQRPEILRLAPTRRSLLGGNSAPCALDETRRS